MAHPTRCSAWFAFTSSKTSPVLSRSPVRTRPRPSVLGRSLSSTALLKTSHDPVRVHHRQVLASVRGQRKGCQLHAWSSTVPECRSFLRARTRRNGSATGPTTRIIGNRVPARGHRWIVYAFKRGAFLAPDLTHPRPAPQRIDTLLCEVCCTPSLVLCAGGGVTLPHATGRTTRNVLMDRGPVASLNPRDGSVLAA